ncbi:MAG: class I SAM-dependent methyltransferase [Caldilinea sp. CFX5]|nr:class I SAM-dependent methyltransferase [Caldilinea sp. CFX5]
MPRLHLLEIHEQPWCPPAIRDGATDCLRFIATVGRQYKQIAPLLQAALLTTNATQIVDLCSGGGGPWLALGRTLNTRTGQPVQIVLTDLYPHERAGQSDKLTPGVTLRFCPTAVDATQPPAELTGFRTLFTAFHHFAPAQAQAILQSAVNAGQGIAIFEQTARTPLGLLVMYLLPWLALVSALAVRPWRLSRLFWTFVIPAIPLMVWFDGVVSCLRTYSTAELQALVAALEPPPTGTTYVWRIGKVNSPLSPLGVSYLIGYPAAESGLSRYLTGQKQV